VAASDKSKRWSAGLLLSGEGFFLAACPRIAKILSKILKLGARNPRSTPDGGGRLCLPWHADLSGQKTKNV
jgi:hypothetical protein